MSAVGRVVSVSRRPVDRQLWALRDDVLRLEEELAVSQAQLNKITKQFNCLVELLHRMFDGDQSAALQVIKLAGLASSNGYEHTLVSDTQRKLMTSVEDSKADADLRQSYLDDRCAYLTQQLARHRAQVQQHTRTRSASTSDGDTVQQTPVNGRQRRSGSAQVSRARSSALRPSMWQNPSDKLSTAPSHGGNIQSEGDAEVQNSAALTYAQFGLFDDDVVALYNHPRSTSDSSSQPTVSQPHKVSRQTERPLKYETMRPVSAVISVKHRPPAARRRVQSAAPRHRPPELCSNHATRQALTTTPDNSDVEDAGKISRRTTEDAWKSRGPERGEDMNKKTKSVGERRSQWKTRGPECVDGFAENTKMMENDFKQQILRLQQQLGFTADGIVLPS